MGKKKIKRIRKGGRFGWIGGLFRGIGWLCLKLIPIALLAGLIIFSGIQIRKVLYEDRLLRVQEIRVLPPDVLSAQSIRTLEDKLLGKNILLLDLRKIASQIELGPGAQSVRVVREMPSTVRIEIQKRKPVANVKLSEDGGYAIVAEDGYIIEIRNELDPAWILIEDLSESMKEPRVGVRLQNKGFHEALRFMTVFRRQSIARKETVTRIRLDLYGNVVVRLGEGPDFQMGRKASERIPVLEKALYLFKTEPRENVEYMDLQYDRIAVKRKQ
jgi:cell division septal protein FtsQ